ncbi:MAG: DUF4249 domain-containing protein, partial [Bacteroidetes bacterium]
MRQLLHLCGWILLASLCFSTTCERPVELDIPEPPSRLVISSAFTLGHPVKVQVTRSQSIFDESAPVNLANARVELWQGEQLLEVLVLVIQEAERIPPYYSTVAFTPVAGVTYTIKAEAPGFEPAMAHSFIPEPVAITSLSVSNIQARADSASREKAYSYRVTLNFDDPVEETNYYHLNIFQEVFTFSLNEAGDTLIDDRSLLRAAINIDDPQVVPDRMIGGVLLKDNPFSEGLALDLSMSIIPEYQYLGQLYVELRTVTEEYYLFYTSYSRQQEQEDGPFIDPVIPFNNVENGHGFFVGYN